MTDTRKPCRRECEIRSIRDQEAELAIGTLRETLEMAVKKLEEKGEDVMFFKLTLRRDIGANQVAVHRLMRESLEAARKSLHYIEPLVIKLLTIIENGKAHDKVLLGAMKGLDIEAQALYADALEAIAKFRALDGHAGGDLQTEPVPLMDPRALTQANKIALAARALLAMDALILRFSQAKYSSIPEVYRTADDMIQYLHARARDEGSQAYAALGISGEWIGDRDRVRELRRDESLMKRLHEMEERHVRFAIQCDDQKDALERANARLVELGAEPVLSRWEKTESRVEKLLAKLRGTKKTGKKKA